VEEITPKRWICTIQTAAGEPAGVGFVVDDSHVLTCAHVVNAALRRDERDQRRPGPNDRVVLEFSLLNATPLRRAGVAEWLPPPEQGEPVRGPSDIALLEVTESLPTAAAAATLAPATEHATVEVFGYPLNPPRADGGWVTGKLLRPVRSGLIQIDASFTAALRAQPGYSGSPVIDTAGGRVVGMLATASILDDQRDCYAIPEEWLRSVWSEPEPLPPDPPKPPDPPAGPKSPRFPWSVRRWKIAVILLILAVTATLLVLSFVPRGGAASDCVELEVSSSTEKAKLLNRLAETFTKQGNTIGGKCVAVHVDALTSGTAKDTLVNGWNSTDQKKPQVWAPTSSLWADQLKADAKSGSLRAIDDGTSITSSVLTIAMPKSIANKLGWPGRAFTWADVLQLATGQRKIDDSGKPFVFGRDDPTRSTSGLAATIATYYAGTQSVEGTVGKASLDNAAVVSFVHRIESAVPRRDDSASPGRSLYSDAVEFMKQLYSEDRSGKPLDVDAVVAQEQLAYSYNHNSPDADLDTMSNETKLNNPLVALYPTDGTLELDHPYVILDDATDQQKTLAAKFRDFLLDERQQQAFRDVGFRTRGNPTRPTPQIVGSLAVPETQNLILQPKPDAATVKRMLNGWEAASRRARVLLVLDVSGSMIDPDPSKFDLLKHAAKDGLQLLGDSDQINVWTFSDSHTEVQQMRKVSEVRASLPETIDKLAARGRTSLYETTLAAQQHILGSYQPNEINMILLLTDGVNEPPDPSAAQALPDKLTRAGHGKAVKIYTIPYGQDADATVLNQIAGATGASSYVEAASDLRNINQVFVDAFSQFLLPGK
jgi:Ca-activated chloride channel homolog